MNHTEPIAQSTTAAIVTLAQDAPVQKRQDWIIPKLEKLSYFLGAGSHAATSTFVATFLTTYLLMIGVDATISAAVLLVLKSWDAINDVLFGYLIDRTRFKPRQGKFWGWLFSGRYLPWFRIAAFILPVALMIIFTVNTEAPLWLRVLQYAIGYFLFDAAYTMTSAPYSCMLTSMTNNPDERTFIQSYSVLGQGLGALPVMFIGTALIAGDFGYTGSAILFGIYGFLMALPMMFLVKERNVSVPAQVAEEQHSLREMLRFLKKSKELLFFQLGQITWGMFYTNALGLFVAYYLFKNVNLSLIFLALSVIPTIILIPFFPVIFKRVNKIAAIRAACMVYFIACLSIWWMGPEVARNNLVVVGVLSGLCGFSNAFVLIGSAMLLPDMAEMAKYRTNTERVGIIFSIHSFVQKLVGSLSTSVALLILSAYGFVSVQANSFEELARLNEQGIGLQTPRALEGLWNTAYLFPALGFGLAALIFMLVKIDRRQIAVIIKANLGQVSREEAEAQLHAQ